MDWSPRRVKPKTDKSGICCFSRNKDNVSKWSHMSICGLLFQWASTKKNQINSVSLVQSGHQYHLIEMKIVLVMIYGSWKILHLVLNNNNSLWWWAHVKCSLPFKGYPIDWIRVLCFTGNVLCHFMILFIIISCVQNYISGVSASLLTWSAVDRGFKPPSGRTRQ